MIRLLPVATAVVIGVLGSSVMAAEPILGVASVIDGDTIEIHGERIRLDAIDAPESRQLCSMPTELPGGADRSPRSPVRILGAPRSVASPAATIAISVHRVCFKNGINLNAWMVEQGWAVAFRKYGLDYMAQEDTARRSRRGLWVGTFKMPWDWRASNR